MGFENPSKHILQFLETRDSGEKNLIQVLRRLVYEVDSDWEERLSYGVPYFFKPRRLVFIWPSSVHPGPKSGVQFGFCQGVFLEDPHGILEKGNRKQVAWVIFHRENEIQKDALKDLIRQAIHFDRDAGI